LVVDEEWMKNGWIELTKALMELALEAEMATHLGYEKHDPAVKPDDNCERWRRDQDHRICRIRGHRHPKRQYRQVYRHL